MITPIPSPPPGLADLSCGYADGTLDPMGIMALGTCGPRPRRIHGRGYGHGAWRYQEHIATRAEEAATLRAALANYEVPLMPTTPHPAVSHDAPTPDDQAVFIALPACPGWAATAGLVGQSGGFPHSTGRNFG